MRKLGALTLVAVLALAGCSSARAYDTPKSLLNAYKSAGGKCSKSLEVSEDMVGAGAHALLCAEGVTMLLVFDSDEAKNRYVAQVGDSDDTELIIGDRWVVVGEDVDQYAGALGGRAA